MSSKKHLSTEYYSLGFQHKLNYTFAKTLSLHPATMEIPGSTDYRVSSSLCDYGVLNPVVSCCLGIYYTRLGLGGSGTTTTRNTGPTRHHFHAATLRMPRGTNAISPCLSITFPAQLHIRRQDRYRGLVQKQIR